MQYISHASKFDQIIAKNYRCSTNYLEIRDGPSKLSPLIGRYCGKEPPSTIFSTGSYLSIHYQTDSFAGFSAWNATYEIGGVL